MKQGYAHVAVVLDRSGSMESVKGDTIGSFNEFIKKQKGEPGECTFSLIQFDDPSSRPTYTKSTREAR